MKKSTKRIISSILSLAMVLSLASCGKKEETPPADGTYKAGEYTGVGQGLSLIHI